VRYTHLWCVKNASTIIGTTDNGFIPSKPLFPGSAIIFMIVLNIGFLSRALEIEHKDSFSSEDTELRRSKREQKTSRQEKSIQLLY